MRLRVELDLPLTQPTSAMTGQTDGPLESGQQNGAPLWVHWAKKEDHTHYPKRSALGVGRTSKSGPKDKAEDRSERDQMNEEVRSASTIVPSHSQDAVQNTMPR